MRNWVDIPIHSWLLQDWLMDGKIAFTRCVGGLPEGAVFIRSWHDLQRDIVHLIYEHPSFPEVEENCQIAYIIPEHENLLNKSIIELMTLLDE